MSPAQLAEGAFTSDVETVVLSDINNTAGIPEFYFACRNNGVKPIAGVDVRNKDNAQLFILIAKSNEGLAEINKYLTEINLKKRKRTDFPQFENVYVVFPLENIRKGNLAENEYIGVRPSQVKSLLSSPFTNLIGKMLMLHTISFRNPHDFELCRNLRAVDSNILISQLPSDIFSSAAEIFVHPKKMREIYADYPQIIVNTLNLLKSCSLVFDKNHKNKKVYSDSAASDVQLLRKNSLEGFG